MLVNILFHSVCNHCDPEDYARYGDSFTNMSEVCKTSERHPMRERFHFFIILYVHNCLENMLNNLCGNGDLLPLDPLKDLCLLWTMDVSGMLVGTVMMSGKGLMYLYNNLEFKNNFEVKKMCFMM